MTHPRTVLILIAVLFLWSAILFNLERARELLLLFLPAPFRFWMMGMLG